jgi:hypothetical protein
MTSVRLCILVLGLSVALSATGQAQSAAPAASVEQRTEAAINALGYFERSHRYNNFQSALLTLLEVNGDDNAAAPLSARWDVREQQIKETYAAWFVVFRALDALKRANYDPLDKANRCNLNIAPAHGFPGMDPKDVSDAQERKAYEASLAENTIRCDTNSLQILLPRLNQEAQEAFHTFLRGLSRTPGPDGDSSGSYFAYALAKSGLGGERIDQMWRIFEKREAPDWKPESLASVTTGVTDDLAFTLTENVRPDEAKKHFAEWLGSRDPRQAAWAAHYVLRDRDAVAIPLLLDYVHKYGFDPEFEAAADLERQDWPEVKRAVYAMAAVMDALIVFRARVPADDLLQIAQTLPDQALILGLLPEPQPRVLQFFYFTGGMKLRQPNERYFRARRLPTSQGEFMRWVAAGNEFANRGSKEFAQELIGHFALVLHLLVFDENTIFTGNGACGPDLSPVREPETGWPPSGVYGLLVPNPAERGFNAETGNANSRAIEPESIVVSQGSRSVEVVRYADSKTNHTQYAFGCPATPVDDIKAHWMEKLGVGEYGKGRSYDLLNPGSGVGTTLSTNRHGEFQFYETIVFRDDEQYHANLKDWIAKQRSAYDEIIVGLLKKGLITSGQAAEPLTIDVYGSDRRMSLTRSNASFLKDAPWEDLAPKDTQISWVGN